MKRAVVLVIAACSRRAPIASCDDDLRGVYVAGDERWMILDSGDVLEAYPLFPDGGGPDPQGSIPADLIVAPRVFDFKRPATGTTGAISGISGISGSSASGSQPIAPGPSRGAARSIAAGTAPLEGTLRRRYMRRAERCEAHVPVHITRCAGNTLELVLADPSPPIAFSPCTWSRPEPSRLVRWRRE